jgi:hypothetical protein
MKTDETVTFDYLKPDFSILKGRRIVMVNLQPEYQFYFKHRIVHWLNQMNQSFDPETNFDAVKIERYMVGDKGTALIVYGFKNLAGTLHFNYDKLGTFKNISFSTEVGIYNNQLKFPSTSQFFTVTADMNTHNEMLDYVVERSLDMSDTSYDDFMVKYSFTADGQKTKDLLILYDYKSKDENMVINAEVESVENFDDFFNKNINVILQSLETFIDMYPQFSMGLVNNNETLDLFYSEMKKMYKDGVFNKGFDENLTIIKMMTI